MAQKKKDENKFYPAKHNTNMSEIGPPKNKYERGKDSIKWMLIAICVAFAVVVVILAATGHA